MFVLLLSIEETTGVKDCFSDGKEYRLAFEKHRATSAWHVPTLNFAGTFPRSVNAPKRAKWLSSTRDLFQNAWPFHLGLLDYSGTE